MSAPGGTVVTVLGPQRRPTVRPVDAGAVTVTAGWREREAEDAELDGLLGGHTVNLRLHARWLDVLDADAELADAELNHRSVLEELQDLYALQVGHAERVAAEIRRAATRPRTRAAALADAESALRLLDAQHLARVAAVRGEFDQAWRPAEREPVARHRAEVAAALAGAPVLVVTGGHVGVLLHLLHVFGLARLIRVRLAGAPLVAWSAGAMALAERVVLFAEHGSAGRRRPEVYAEGLGAYAGVLPFPHARRRLRLDDAEHLGMMARRFAPRHCLLLGDGQRVALRAGQSLPAGARILTDAGVAVAPG